MPFELPDRPYELNALEPHISAKTLEIHHGKHHAAYVANLNSLTEHSDYANQSLEFIIKDAGPGGTYNNAAQVWNHTFYWESMSPVSPEGGGKGGNEAGSEAGGDDGGKAEPRGKLAAMIEEDAGGFANLKKAFTKAALNHFGSGWAWLALNEENNIVVLSTSNADNPINLGLRPLLVCDVWEHAYYLDFQNRRPDYVAAWWNLVNWEAVEKRL